MSQETISTAPWPYQPEYNEVVRRLQAIPANEQDGREAYKLYMRALIFAPPAVLSEIAAEVRGTAWEDFISFLMTGLGVEPANAKEETTNAIKDWLSNEGELDESVSLGEVGQLVDAMLDTESNAQLQELAAKLHQLLFPGRWTTGGAEETEVVTDDDDDLPPPKPGAAIDWLLFEINHNRHDPDIVHEQAVAARYLFRLLADRYDIAV